MHRISKRGVAATTVLCIGALAAVAIGVTSQGASAASSACKQSGTLTYGLAGGGIQSLDPAVSDLAARTVIMPLLFPALTAMKPDGTVGPDLATKWKVSSDGKTWWFYLRHDVKYADGRPFTSADVVQNILHDLNPKTGALVRQYINDVRSVRAITKYEVRFKTGSPRATLPAHPFRRAKVTPGEREQPPLPGLSACACGDPSCTSLTGREFAPGHDAKRKSALWALARQGQDAVDELRRRKWAVPPEMR